MRLSAGAEKEAFADVEEALRIARDIDAIGLEGAALSMRGQLLCRTGRWSEARECLDEAMVATGRSGDLPSRCEALLSRAAAHLRLGDHAAAARDADEAGTAAVRIGDRYLLAVARQARGGIALGGRRPERRVRPGGRGAGGDQFAAGLPGAAVRRVLRPALNSRDRARRRPDPGRPGRVPSAAGRGGGEPGASKPIATRVRPALFDMPGCRSRCT